VHVDGKRSRCEAFAMMRTGIAFMSALLIAGCVQVTAPEKPIEINLNVKIRQEVVVSLQKDVQDLDKKYPGVF
jgi:hypothetical protein